jgi:hypothetical protein
MSKGLNYLTTKVVALPLSGATSLTAPKVSEFTGVTAKTLDTYMLPTSKLPGRGADKVVNEMGIDESVDVEAITGSAATGWFIDFFYDYTASTGAVSATDLRTVFTASGLTWALLVRTGKPFSTALAVGDVVDVYSVASGGVQPLRDFQGYFKGKVEFHNMGALNEQVTMVT